MVMKNIILMTILQPGGELTPPQDRARKDGTWHHSKEICSPQDMSVEMTIIVYYG